MVTCPKCAAACEVEPGAAHCRMCGTVWYEPGPAAHLRQLVYERASGLGHTTVGTNDRSSARRRFVASARDASS